VVATDVLSMTEAKRILRIADTDTSEDAELAVYISAASELLDNEIGPTVARAIGPEVHDGVNHAGTDYRKVIILRNRPVLSIASLTVDSTTTLTQTTDYLAAPYSPDRSLFSGQLRRRWGSAWGWWEYGIGNIVCSYTAGRVAATSNVSSRIKRACGIVLENLWRDREPSIDNIDEFTTPRQAFPAFAMPRAAAQLVRKEMGQVETFGIGGG